MVYSPPVLDDGSVGYGKGNKVSSFWVGPSGPVINR